jgi:hypothetical protein
MEDVDYKGWIIEAQSYESDGGRWRPKALVSFSEGGTIHQRLVPAPLDITFDTEKDAEIYAVQMAKKWIDDNG